MPKKRKGGRKKMAVRAKGKNGGEPIPFPGKPYAAKKPKGKPRGKGGKAKAGK